MTISLRPYQEESLAALFDHWRDNGGNPLIVLPTGAGKSIVIADLIRRLLGEYPHLRIFCATHTRELIVQNYQELIRLWPQAPAGIYSAGLGRRDAHARVLFCGIQSVFKRVNQIGAADLIIVDEAHLIPRDTSTMYGKFFERMRELNPYLRVVGLTATPYRLDTGRLDEGKDAMFERIVYEANVLDLIRDGYLSPLISKASLKSMDLTGLGTRAGEYITEQAEQRAMADGVVENAVDEMIALASDRRAWLAFCVTVHHARAVAHRMNERGIAAAVVHGEMNKGERDSVIRQFKEGHLRALTSVNVLSIGFNVPHVDMIALLRPTKSSGLYVQQVGRAFRRAPGKENALILDFANVVRMHGPVDAIVPNSQEGGGGKKEKEGEADVKGKVCPKCQTYAIKSAMSCASCGHEWPPKEVKHEMVADDGTGILSTERVRPQMVPVVDWRFDRHDKWGSPSTVRVTYTAGLMQYRKWLAFEHANFARQKACQWWALHGGDRPFPTTVDEAIERANDGELVMPAGITVRPEGQFFEITSYHFNREKEAAE